MSTELEFIDKYGEELEKVANEMVKGEFNATQIARTLNMPRAQVLEYMDAWRSYAQNSKNIQARVRENLVEMDRHYSLIIKEQWLLANDPETPAAVRATLYKNIQGAEKDRQEVLQKAGLYESAGVGDEMVAMEEKAEAIKALLKELTKKYPQTKAFILEGLQKIYGDPQTVEGDVIA